MLEKNIMDYDFKESFSEIRAEDFSPENMFHPDNTSVQISPSPMKENEQETRRTRMSRKKKVKEYNSLIYRQQVWILALAILVQRALTMSFISILPLLQDSFKLDRWSLVILWTLEPISEAITLQLGMLNSLPFAIITLLIANVFYSRCKSNLTLLLVARILHGAGSGLLGQVLLHFNERMFNYISTLGYLIGPLLTTIFFESSWDSHLSFMVMALLFTMILILQLSLTFQNECPILMQAQKGEQPLLHFSFSFLLFAILYDFNHLLPGKNIDSDFGEEIIDLACCTSVLFGSIFISRTFQFLLEKGNLRTPHRMVVLQCILSIVGIYTLEKVIFSVAAFGFAFGAVNFNLVNLPAICGGKLLAPIVITAVRLMHDNFSVGILLVSFACVMLPLSFV